MAASYCTQELEQAATQLLPREIIAEIGVADGGGYGTVTASAAVIEGLATHLASILGLAGVATPHRPRPADATPHDQRHVSNWVLTTNGGGNMMVHAAAPCSGTNDAMALCHATVEMFATTSPMIVAPPDDLLLLLPEMRRNGSGTGVFLPARYRGGTGTGVFMPLPGAYSATPFKSSRNRGVKPPRLMRKEAQMAMAMRQQVDNAAVFQARPQLPVLP